MAFPAAQQAQVDAHLSGRWLRSDHIAHEPFSPFSSGGPLPAARHLTRTWPFWAAQPHPHLLEGLQLSGVLVPSPLALPR